MIPCCFFVFVAAARLPFSDLRHGQQCSIARTLDSSCEMDYDPRGITSQMLQLLCYVILHEFIVC